MYVCMYVCMYVRPSVRPSVCLYVCIYIYITYFITYIILITYLPIYHHIALLDLPYFTTCDRKGRPQRACNCLGPLRHSRAAHSEAETGGILVIIFSGQILRDVYISF